MNPEENATTPSMILWFKMQKPTADFIKILLQFYCKKKKRKIFQALSIYFIMRN